MVTDQTKPLNLDERSKKMKKMALILTIAMIFGVSTVAVAVEVEDYSSTINLFKESPAVAKFFKNSYGYAVFPTIGKAGFAVNPHGILIAGNPARLAVTV